MDESLHVLDMCRPTFQYTWYLNLVVGFCSPPAIPANGILITWRSRQKNTLVRDHHLARTELPLYYHYPYSRMDKLHLIHVIDLNLSSALFSCASSFARISASVAILLFLYISLISHVRFILALVVICIILSRAYIHITVFIYHCQAKKEAPKCPFFKINFYYF